MSEQKERRKYDREFKVEAVRLYESSGKSMVRSTEPHCV